MDPKLASYGVESPIYAVVQLAQTTMRSELGKITLDKTFEERDTLNEKIVVCSLSFFISVSSFRTFPVLKLNYIAKNLESASCLISKSSHVSLTIGAGVTPY